MTLPQYIRPMMATLTDKPFDDANWEFEIKHDGYRIIAFITKNDVRLKTRRNVDYTDRYPAVASALRKAKPDTIIDGEIVVLNPKGISDFNALQNWKGNANGDLFYYAFDLLYYQGKSYMNQPLSARKALLKRILPKSNPVRYCDAIVGKGTAMFKLATKHGLEGLVAKRSTSIYRPGIRTKDWRKIKTYKEAPFLIAGFTRQHESSLLSSVILATCNGTVCQFAGEVATGFDEKEAQEILDRIKVVKKCPLAKEPIIKAGRWGRKAPAVVIWCRPQLACKVRYLEFTAGELRHASFQCIL